MPHIGQFVLFLYSIVLFLLILLFLFQVDFELYVKWPEYSYLYLYAMFYKAEVLKNDHNFFRPVSQLKTSVIVWYLLSSEPPSHSVSHLTPSQAKSIWGLTDKCLETHYEESQQGMTILLIQFYSFSAQYKPSCSKFRYALHYDDYTFEFVEIKVLIRRGFELVGSVQPVSLISLMRLSIF